MRRPSASRRALVLGHVGSGVGVDGDGLVEAPVCHRRVRDHERHPEPGRYQQVEQRTHRRGRPDRETVAERRSDEVQADGVTNVNARIVVQVATNADNGPTRSMIPGSLGGRSLVSDSRGSLIQPRPSVHRFRRPWFIGSLGSSIRWFRVHRFIGSRSRAGDRSAVREASGLELATLAIFMPQSRKNLLSHSVYPPQRKVHLLRRLGNLLRRIT